MGRSQNLGTLVCGGVSYTQVLSFHMVLSYSRVSTVSVLQRRNVNHQTLITSFFQPSLGNPGSRTLGDIEGLRDIEELGVSRDCGIQKDTEDVGH